MNNENIDGANMKVRDGIGIDRFTGGVKKGANFSYQYVMGKTFETHIQIRNFELWQLGLLEYMLKDFKEELVPIGFGKTRGLGKVKGNITGAEIIFYGLNAAAIEATNKKAEIKGIGSLYTDGDKGLYRFADELPIEVEYEESAPSSIKAIVKLNAVQTEKLFTQAAALWAMDKNTGYFKAAQEARNAIIKGAKDA